ncbi:hypothetical protein MAR_007039 [Mya arenaria]|uniref:Uncharacterized protein n=1 Tax=Mya arenaria TaxID=6604 RepID=A0ABY7DCC7_MYAAR|nr:hypothetical protein MAR_007039 [Mya arenaria]
MTIFIIVNGLSCVQDEYDDDSTVNELSSVQDRNETDNIVNGLSCVQDENYNDNITNELSRIQDRNENDNIVNELSSVQNRNENDNIVNELSRVQDVYETDNIVNGLSHVQDVNEDDFIVKKSCQVYKMLIKMTIPLMNHVNEAGNKVNQSSRVQDVNKGDNTMNESSIAQDINKGDNTVNKLSNVQGVNEDKNTRPTPKKLRYIDSGSDSDNVPLINLVCDWKNIASDCSDIDDDLDKPYQPCSKDLNSTDTEYMSDVSEKTKNDRKRKIKTKPVFIKAIRNKHQIKKDIDRKSGAVNSLNTSQRNERKTSREGYNDASFDKRSPNISKEQSATLQSVTKGSYREEMQEYRQMKVCRINFSKVMDWRVKTNLGQKISWRQMRHIRFV